MMGNTNKQIDNFGSRDWLQEHLFKDCRNKNARKMFKTTLYLQLKEINLFLVIKLQNSPQY